MNLQDKAKSLPSQPGVYLFYDTKDTVLYVGKAKRLNKRVASYFRKNAPLSNSKKQMVSLIKKIDTILTDTESEALLLENNLIKKYKPRYNVIFKDDKNYLYIKIENHDDFPKIITTRDTKDRKAQYFGPYTSGYVVKNTLKVLRKLFPYRDCNLVITKNSVQQRKHRACLKFYINNCAGPCIGKIQKEDYADLIERCKLFLKGKNTEVISQLKSSMKEASKQKEYEKAAVFRDQIQAVQKIDAEQKIVSAKHVDEDYISVYESGKKKVVSLIIVRDGKIIDQENVLVKAPVDTPEAEIISSFLLKHYAHTENFPKTIYVSDEPIFPLSAFKKILHIERSSLTKEINRIKIQKVQIGSKKKLLEMGRKNAKRYLIDRQKPFEGERLGLSELKDVLTLPRIPRRIECFDISNIQGTNPVGSMSVFIDGKPAKQEYRRFKIKTVKGANDFAMMHEVITRRLKKTFIEKEWPQPDLIVIDGGKGQLSFALKAQSELSVSVPTISLAKKLEEIYTKQSSHPIRLADDSDGLHILQQVRDEAHRFAVTYHRKLRGSSAVRSKLDEIPGIGPATRKKLLNYFGSFKKIKAASVDELSAVVSLKLAQKINRHFSS